MTKRVPRYRSRRPARHHHALPVEAPRPLGIAGQMARASIESALSPLLMGAALFFAAPASRAPGVLRTLGVLIFVAGVITLFFGPERFRGLVDWWSAHGPRFARIWAALALVLGVLLAYALVP